VLADGTYTYGPACFGQCVGGTLTFGALAYPYCWECAGSCDDYGLGVPSGARTCNGGSGSCDVYGLCSTCFDGVMNGSEQGIDCGPDCIACG
jgi:hypothetical protein